MYFTTTYLRDVAITLLPEIDRNIHNFLQYQVLQIPYKTIYQ